MADKKASATKTVYNTADGPRSIFAADGVNHILRPGESVEAEFHAAELDDLTPGLTTTKPKDEPDTAAPAAGPGSPARADAAAEAIAADAATLSAANDRDALLDIAKKEKVAVETDDNKDQLALKIAQSRAGVKPE